MKRCSASTVIKGLPIKTVRPHFTPSRTAGTEKADNQQRRQGYGETGTLNVKCYNTETCLKKLTINVPYDLAMLLLDNHLCLQQLYS